MITGMTITPKFDAKTWSRKKIQSDWFLFQTSAFKVFEALRYYMIQYIAKNKKRSPSSGKLEQAIWDSSVYEHRSRAFFFGIGKISYLQEHVPYWFVLNSGKMVSGEAFIPFRGKRVKGSFVPSGRPHPDGSGELFALNDKKFMIRPKKPIRPINYIEATKALTSKMIDKIMPISMRTY